MKETALIRAAHNGHLHTVRFLLERGAQANALDLVRTARCPVRNSVALLQKCFGNSIRSTSQLALTKYAILCIAGTGHVPFVGTCGVCHGLKQS